MSEVNNAPVWYSPFFPERGRLFTVSCLTGKNDHPQDSQLRAYQFYMVYPSRGHQVCIT